MLTETPERPADARPSLAGPPLNAPPQVNECVRRFVQEAVDLCQPDSVVWCDGSRAERDRLLEQGVNEGVFVTGFGFPVVPHGVARVRCQISAGHSRSDLDFAVQAFKKVGAKLGII